MTVTIKDVARMAGVSISTVSRVINNSKPVSSDIRDRVEKVIAETKYVPNPVARSLVMRRSQFIGVIVPNISNMKIAEILNGIEEVGRMYQYDILLCNSYGEVKEEQRYISILKSKQVAGIILVSENLTKEVVDDIDRSGIPTVFVAKNAKGFPVISVGINHFKASYDMTKYLLGKGHKKIGFIRSSLDGDFSTSDVFKGFQHAMEEEGVKVDPKLLFQGDGSAEESYQILTCLIEGGKLPDVMVTASDFSAIGAMNAVRDQGLSVPKDIGVTGYDDLEIAALVRPALTTVHQPLYDIGAISIRMIIKLAEGEEITQEEAQVTLPHQIIERQSVNLKKKKKSK